MSNQMKLAVGSTPEGWSDLTVGEPHLIREALYESLGETVLEQILDCSDVDSMCYMKPEGGDLLIDLLSKRYGGKIILGAGATQLLNASFYALKKMKRTRLCVPRPWWILIPEMLDSIGLNWIPLDAVHSYPADCMLVCSPNNPDGKTLSKKDLEKIAKDATENDVKIIHDAAYMTPVYVDQSHIHPCGSVQMYSISKMYGLSGLRLGFAVVNDEEMYEHMRTYMEINSMGVSRLSQHTLYKLLKYFDSTPNAEKNFVKLAKKRLKKNRDTFIKDVDKRVLDCSDTKDQHGMFLWVRPGLNYDENLTKCKIIDGTLFGKPGYLRVSLALKHEDLKKAVENLNSSIKSK